MKLTGAQILLEELKHHGITEVFGYPGGTVINIYDELYKAEEKGTIKHYITAHEQGAVHAADGYARVSGKTGVVIATSGPGATNTVTGIANAYLDSIPLVIITGNVATALIGRDSFQEVDMVGVTMPITKHNYIVKDTADLQETIRKAFYIANKGKKGPVLIDIPKDIQINTCDYKKNKKFTFEKDNHKKHQDVHKALELITNSKKPFLYVGGGVVSASASELVLQLATKLNAPIGCSLMGLSAVPRDYESFLGLIGMHGRYASSKAQAECDLLIAIGTRFSDRTTGNKEKFRKNCKVLQIDVDRAEINKNVTTDCWLEGDVRSILSVLLPKIPQRENTEWLNYVKELRWCEDNHSRMKDKEFCPYSIIKEVARHMEPDTCIATDVGQHQMWTAQYYPFKKPRTFVTSGGLGAMGFGLGAAIGACLANGRKRTVLFTSDGSFHMNLNELATAVSNNLPILIVLLDNNALGMVKQWQDMFFEKRHSQTILNRKTDYVKLIEAFGGKGVCVTNQKELVDTLNKASKVKNGPMLLRCMIDQSENVIPMIPPNGSIDDIVIK